MSATGYRYLFPPTTIFPKRAKTSPSISIPMSRKMPSAFTASGLRRRRDFFQLLISVSGIGPKLGKDILSNIQVNELASALSRGDLARLSAIPGIGKKTAERLVLELKDKVLKLDVSLSPPGSCTSHSSAIIDDVASALINLGYKEAVVKKALAELEHTGGSIHGRTVEKGTETADEMNVSSTWYGRFLLSHHHISFNENSMTRIIAPEITDDDLFVETTLRPRLLSDYVGQEKAKGNLRIFIDAAQGADESLGPRSPLRPARPREDHPLQHHRRRNGGQHQIDLRTGHRTAR